MIGGIVIGLWAAWISSWMIAARWSAPVQNRVTGRRALSYRVLSLAGAILLASPLFRHDRALWPITHVAAWILTALVAVGMAFTWWARIHLGNLWSSQVTRKTDHRIVDTGPYALVRHPIYTGIILAAFATAILEARSLALSGAALITLAWLIKARLEESFLRQELGAADYDAYAARVPMLMPFSKF